MVAATRSRAKALKARAAEPAVATDDERSNGTSSSLRFNQCQSQEKPTAKPSKGPQKWAAGKAISDEDNDKMTSDIRSALTGLLSALRSEQSTICPSQVARKLHERHPAAYPDWRALMDPVRDVVWVWVEEGRAQVTQGGEVRPREEREVLKGPIRVRRGPKFDPR